MNFAQLTDLVFTMIIRGELAVTLLMTIILETLAAIYFLRSMDKN